MAGKTWFLKGVYKLKAAILAGGFGMRIREKLDDKPKAMVEIGDKPILWHIMKIYSLSRRRFLLLDRSAL